MLNFQVTTFLPKKKKKKKRISEHLNTGSSAAELLGSVELLAVYIYLPALSMSGLTLVKKINYVYLFNLFFFLNPCTPFGSQR